MIIFMSSTDSARVERGVAFFLVAQPVFSSWRLGGGGRGGEVAQMPRFNGSSSALFLLRINITFVGLFGAFKNAIDRTVHPGDGDGFNVNR